MTKTKEQIAREFAEGEVADSVTKVVQKYDLTPSEVVQLLLSIASRWITYSVSHTGKKGWR